MRSEEIINIFNKLFRDTERTELVGGGTEPVYEPGGEALHRIVFRADFAASALHEVAHWCIAGTRRRQLTDYGYWYYPEGRGVAEQEEFERVEVKPQSLEWLFAVAAGVTFHVSIDNLKGTAFDPRRFRHKIREEALAYLERGLPRRAGLFLQELFARSQRHDVAAAFWRQVAVSGVLPE